MASFGNFSEKNFQMSEKHYDLCKLLTVAKLSSVATLKEQMQIITGISKKYSVILISI